VPAPLLTLRNVHRHFGGVRAVDGVSFDVPEGAIVGLIGPNGAGKTTLLNVLTGHTAADDGQVVLRGDDGTDDDISTRRPHEIAARGVARTFQNIRLYRGLTSSENVIAGMHLHRPRRARREQLVDDAAALLRRVGLDPATHGARAAATLAYADRRRLELARALALRPRLLLLDEPGAGMNHAEKDRLLEVLQRLNAEGLTVLLVDHDMRLVMRACQHLVVLNFGRRIAEGPPAEISENHDVITAYLGTRRDPSPSPPRSGGSGTSPATPRAARTGHALLEVRDLDVAYGSVRAVRGVSFEVGEGECVAVLGANGAGKSTILSTLSGLVRPRAGTARFDDLDLATARSDRIVGAGLVQVPEGREILGRLTVRENLELAAAGARRRRNIGEAIDEQFERFSILAERAGLPASQLSGGEQQILAIARALVAAPRLLLLDEPSLGLAPQLAETVFEIIEQIHRDGITVLLVEQNAYRALDLADRAYVIETGRILLSGSAAELRDSPEVQRAYLGG
jgi:branched-chain amino acid transport system ATP-binding protein